MKLENGKYEFKLDDQGRLVCLRYGEPWREDFVGDNAVMALYLECERLRRIITERCDCGAKSEALMHHSRACICRILEAP